MCRWWPFACAAWLGLAACEGPPGPAGPPGPPGSGIDASVIAPADVSSERDAGDVDDAADARPDVAADDLGRPDPRLVCQSCHPGLDVSALNLIALHDPNARRYNRNCLHCHQDILNRTTLDPRVTEIHRRMLPHTGTWRGSPRNEDCIFCHAAVDLSGERSAAHLRRQVSTRACTGCHSSGRWDYYLP
jgi:hypothetical protein